MVSGVVRGLGSVWDYQRVGDAKALSSVVFAYRCVQSDSVGISHSHIWVHLSVTNYDRWVQFGLMVSGGVGCNGFPSLSWVVMGLGAAACLWLTESVRGCLGLLDGR